MDVFLAYFWLYQFCIISRFLSGEKAMVTRASKLRQSIGASSNSDDQSVMGLEEVEDEVIKDDDRFKIIEPITTSSSAS